VPFYLLLDTDLYGNDEADFTDHVQEEKEVSAQAELASTEVPAAQPTSAVSKSSKVESPPQSASALSSSQPISPQSFIAPATQQIPTYEQPQSAEYREPPPARHENGYQSIPVPERTIRPSEMKDEG
jgi:hypothetical protein